MDEAVARAIQREAADAILDRGVSIPLKELRLPLLGPVRLRVTLRRPRMAGQIEFARTYLSMGVTADEIESMNKEEQMRFIADHGDKVCRMIACALCTGPVRKFFMRPVVWFLCNCVEHRFQIAAVHKFVSLMGTDPFMPIIRLAERTNPLKVRLSRVAKGG